MSGGLGPEPPPRAGYRPRMPAARDASFWRLFKGNETLIEKNVAIDITPPTLELIADDRYVNFGGVGVIVYKPSADTAKSGVKKPAGIAIP